MNVAVVIPNLNYGAYLERAIVSAQQQTHPPYEIIVVDGGSTDNSYNIARHYDVTWLNRSARGQAHARNEGIAYTRCPFILPLDADDWIEPNYIESCLERMTAAVGIVATGLVWPNGSVQWPVPPFTREDFLTGNRIFCCSMFRRICWEQVGGYDINPTYEDWEFWLSIVSKGWEVGLVPLPLFHYMPHENSSTTNMKPEHHAQYVDYILRKHGDHRV